MKKPYHSYQPKTTPPFLRNAQICIRLKQERTALRHIKKPRGLGCTGHAEIEPEEQSKTEHVEL